MKLLFRFREENTMERKCRDDKAAAEFSSRLAQVFKRYVDLKRALGRRFDEPARTLQSLDRFLQDQPAKYSGPERRRISGLVPDPGASCVRRPAWSNDGGLQLLPLSPPDRAPVLRS